MLEAGVVELHHVRVRHAAPVEAVGEVHVHDVEAPRAEAELDRGHVDDDVVAGPALPHHRHVRLRRAALARDVDEHPLPPARRRVRLDDRAPPQRQHVTRQAASRASSSSAIATSSIPSSASTRHALAGLVVVLGPVGEVHTGQPGRHERVGVRPAAAEHAARLVSAAAQGGLGRDHRGRRGLGPVAVEEPLHRHLDVALVGVGAVVHVVHHLRHERLRRGVIERAALRLDAAALGHHVRGDAPALDPADVRGGLLVDPAEAHRGHGRGGRRDRASALLRPDPGVRGGAVEVGLQAVVGRRGDDHLADGAWRGRTRSRTPSAARRRRTPWPLAARSPRTR